MKNETAFWNKVQRVFKQATPKARLRRLNDAVQAGVPDGMYIVEGVAGLLEVKYTKRWPVRANTTVKVGHGVTPNQRSYLEDWIAHQGSAYVLLGVEDSWFLLLPSDIPMDNRMTIQRLQETAVLQGEGNRSLATLPGALAELGRIRYTSVLKSA